MENESDQEGIPLQDDSACPTFRTYPMRTRCLENVISYLRQKKGDGMLEPFFGLDATGMGASG